MEIGEIVQEALFDWKTKLDENEWHFAEYYGKIHNGFTPVEAFDAIPTLARVVLELIPQESMEEFVCDELVQFLLSLIMRANTTEIFDSVRDDIVSIEKVFKARGFNSEKIDEIKRFYRLE